MVDVGDKAVTQRRAVATGRIAIAPDALAAIRDGAAKKGDVLSVAREHKYFPEEALTEIESFICDPIAWSAAHGGAGANVLELVRGVTRLAGNLPTAAGMLAVHSSIGAVSALHYAREGAKIVIATPGRLCDFLDRRLVKLDHVRALVRSDDAGAAVMRRLAPALGPSIIKGESLDALVEPFVDETIIDAVAAEHAKFGKVAAAAGIQPE